VLASSEGAFTGPYFANFAKLLRGGLATGLCEFLWEAPEGRGAGEEEFREFLRARRPRLQLCKRPSFCEDGPSHPSARL
jgi:hypothetical protein